MADTGMVRLSVHSETKDSMVKVLASLKTPESGERQPSDIVCIIDISGSMSTEATIAGAGGGTESHGLTLLDVAKHGVRTIANALGDKDRLAVVSFNHGANTVFSLTWMDGTGRTMAEEKLDSLLAGGGTNIWKGLVEGLDCLRNAAEKGRFGHVMLLTDGASSDRSNILPNLMNYQQRYESLPGSINTFGFGYNLDSALLVELATAGMGSYSFIPDAGFVGTAFVSMMSQLLVTLAQEVRLIVEKPSSAELKVHGGWSIADNGDNYSICLGSLQFGQSKDVVLTMKTPSQCTAGGFDVGGTYRNNEGEDKKIGFAEVKWSATGGADANPQLEENWCRSIFAEALMDAVTLATMDRSEESLKGAFGKVQHVVNEAKASPAASSPFIQSLLEDACGQSSEALSRLDWFARWGMHYLPSVMFAHKLQFCNNFKDPGVQVYGGSMFKKLRDEADDIFCNLPAPKPTARRPASASYNRQSSPQSTPVVSMAAYHDSSAVCVDGSSLADLPGGGQRKVAELAKGDCVLGLDGAVAEVVCLVRVACPGGSAQLTELPGGLRLTPFHPIFMGGTWRFPADVAGAEEVPCDAVYSFVLDGAPAMCVGGTPCAALGHGIEEGAAGHPYFATRRVVEDLRRFPGFRTGLIELPTGAALRDPETGLVCRLAVTE